MMYESIKILMRGPGGIVAKVLALSVPGSHMSTGSNPGSPAYHPAPCLWPGKAVGDGPRPEDPATAWDTGKRLQAPGFSW